MSETRYLFNINNKRPVAYNLQDYVSRDHFFATLNPIRANEETTNYTQRVLGVTKPKTATTNVVDTVVHVVKTLRVSKQAVAKEMNAIAKWEEEHGEETRGTLAESKSAPEEVAALIGMVSAASSAGIGEEVVKTMAFHMMHNRDGKFTDEPYDKPGESTMKKTPRKTNQITLDAVRRHSDYLKLLAVNAKATPQQFISEYNKMNPGESAMVIASDKKTLKMFQSAYGERYSEPGVQQAYQKIKDKIGVTDGLVEWTFHTTAQVDNAAVIKLAGRNTRILRNIGIMLNSYWDEDGLVDELKKYDIDTIYVEQDAEMETEAQFG